MRAAGVRGARALAVSAVLLVVLPAIAEGDPIETIEHPTRVPEFKFISLGNGIEPGASGTYGFAMRNRYNASMENITLTVEAYKWATVESALNLSDIGSGAQSTPHREFVHPPVFVDTNALRTTVEVPRLEPNASFNVRAQIRTSPDTPEGVYFTRHQIEFDYPNVTVPGTATPRLAHFVMKSRGHFTAEEFASINYSDLEGSLDALGVQGIVPDSSFSVKRPAPLWPLALVAGAAAVTGGLAVALYLTDTYPGRYPRLKGALLRLSGKSHVWRALAREEFRARVRRGDPPV